MHLGCLVRGMPPSLNRLQAAGSYAKYSGVIFSLSWRNGCYWRAVNCSEERCQRKRVSQGMQKRQRSKHFVAASQKREGRARAAQEQDAEV